MLSNIQKLAFSFSVIAHVVVFYPLTTELEAPSSTSKTLSFSLVRSQANQPTEQKPENEPESKITEVIEEVIEENIEENIERQQPPEEKKLVKKQPLQPVKEPSDIQSVKKTLKPEVKKQIVKKQTTAKNRPVTKLASIAPEPETKPSRSLVTDAKAESQKTEITFSNPVNRQIQQDYLQHLVARINANKHYPQKARRRGWEGQVSLKFSIFPSGEVRNVKILSSSDYAILDKSALKAIHDSLPFEPFPSNLGLAKLDLELPIIYQLK
jgi:protein TonB